MAILKSAIRPSAKPPPRSWDTPRPPNCALTERKERSNAMKEKRIRDKQMIVRFTERELSEFTDKMKRAKSKSRSDFIMSLVKTKPIIVPDGLPEIAAELKRHGNNLNQIARIFNQTRSCPYQLNHALENCEMSYNAVKNLVFEINGRK